MYTATKRNENKKVKYARWNNKVGRGNNKKNIGKPGEVLEVKTEKKIVAKPGATFNSGKRFVRGFKTHKSEGDVKTTNPDVVSNAVRNLRLGDVRSANGPKNSVQSKLTVEYSSHGTTVAAPLNDVSIQGVVASMVSLALTRGMDPVYALPAAQQACNVLKSSALNSDPIVGEIPGYLDFVATSLRPRTVLHKGSAFKYKWETSGATVGMPSSLVYGNTNNNGAINYGILAAASQNPYGLPSVVAANVPSAEEAKQAFAQLTSTLSGGNKGTTPPLTKDERKAVLYDASAFAAPTIVDGIALGGQGGTVVRLGNEASVNFPVASRFVTAQSTYRDYNRACNINTEAGGGPMELGMYAMQFRPKELAAIKKPVIKFIDANSLMFIYFYTWKLALEAWCATSEFQYILNSGVGNAEQAIVNRAIPVSMEEATLALRSEYMKTFADTQYGAQSMGPTTDVNETWLGYSCAVGTCPNAQITSLFMSGAYAENLRALSGVSVYDAESVKVGKMLSEAKKHRPLTHEENELLASNRTIRTFLPVLGSYLDSTLTESDFNVNYTQSRSIGLFHPEASKIQKKNAAPPASPNLGKPVVKPKLAPSFRLNDGSTGNGYLALNDTAIVSEIIRKMNKSIEENAKYIAGLCANVNEPSAVVLRQLGTNIFALRDSSDSDSSSYFDIAKIQTISYGYLPMKVVVEQFKFLGPIHFFSAERNDINLKSSNDRETELVTIGSSVSSVSLRSYLESIAELGVSDGTKTNIEKKIDTLNMQGMGGIFSDIASAFAPVVNVGLRAAGTGLDMIC